MKRCFLIGTLLLIVFSCVYHDTSLIPEESQPPENPVSCDDLAVSWQNDIRPIMQASCVIPDCHDGISLRSWNSYNEAKRSASAIKRRTQDRSMPVDSSLPQEQIDKIACWVDAGSPNN